MQKIGQMCAYFKIQWALTQTPITGDSSPRYNQSPVVGPWHVPRPVSTMMCPSVSKTFHGLRPKMLIRPLHLTQTSVQSQPLQPKAIRISLKLWQALRVGANICYIIHYSQYG